MSKRMTADPWFIRRMTLDRLVGTLEASAKLAPMLDQELAYLEAAEAVRERMKLSKDAVDPEMARLFDSKKADS